MAEKENNSIREIDDEQKMMFEQITTAADLEKIRENLSGFYELKNDIELEGEFEPIGNQFEPFCGILDGNEHSICGLRIMGKTQYTGLFAGNDGTVRNLHMKDIDIRANGYTGAVAGKTQGVFKIAVRRGKSAPQLLLVG